jgi:hypothetical protein
MDLTPGWIHEHGINLHLAYMGKKTGSILEAGSAAGRLFNYLHREKPKWKYTGVDDWDNEIVYLQADLAKDYFEDELGERVTEKMFKHYCPFADAHNMRFEEYDTDELYDIVSIGQISKKINWYETFTKAFKLCKDDGYVIGRNSKHKVYGSIIEETIKDYNKVGQVWGYFVLKNGHGI